VWDKVALARFSLEYFGFPCQSVFDRWSTITIIYHLELANRPIVAAIPSGLSVIPLIIKVIIIIIPFCVHLLARFEARSRHSVIWVISCNAFILQSLGYDSSRNIELKSVLDAPLIAVSICYNMVTSLYGFST
jgi:hypothetical protein